MYYGLIDEFEALKICKRVCLSLGNGANNTADALLIETAMQETQLGRYRDPNYYGAGVGVCQFDEIAFDDVKRRTRKAIFDKIDKEFGIKVFNVKHRELAFSPMLSFIFCRLFYRLIPEPIPKTVLERANYWKKYYNTVRGKGHAGEYVVNARNVPVEYL